MVHDPKLSTKEAFRHLGPKNPVHRLNDWDREILLALLNIYAAGATLVSRRKKRKGVGLKKATRLSQKRNGGLNDDPSETLAQLVAEAATFGAKLETEVFGGQFCELLHPILFPFEDLPKQLIEFSKHVGHWLDLVGKRGQKTQTFVNRELVVASEFVRLKTSRHNDEHLAELFQAIGKRSPSQDFSGAAICKVRQYFKTHYPEYYASALETARELTKVRTAF